MTRKEIEQCRSLKHEIIAIEASMNSPRSNYVVVFYKDYRSGKGIPKAKQERDDGEEELKSLKAKLSSKRRKLMKRLREAEEFLDSIEDSEIRTILRMYYINGSSQKEIGEELHYTQTAISQKIRGFWLSRGDTDRSRSRRSH